MQEKSHNDLALAVLDGCLWMTLAMIDGAGEPYCLPLHVAREGEWLYFHCAPDGEKIRALRAHPQVCLTAVGPVRVVQQRFTTEYTAAVVRGRAEEVVGDRARITALEIICRRFTPEAMDSVPKAIDAWLSKTAVWRIHMDSVTGKRLPEA